MIVEKINEHQKAALEEYTILKLMFFPLEKITIEHPIMDVIGRELCTEFYTKLAERLDVIAEAVMDGGEVENLLAYD